MTQMMQVIYFSCITDHMWINRYVPIQQESLCNIYIRKLKSYCKHTQHCNCGKSRPIRHAIWLFWGSHGFPHNFPLGPPPHYEAILGFFANSQDCSHSKVLESLFSANLASPYSQKRRFYIFDFIRRYIWSKIQLVMKDLKHSIQNLLNNIVEHITSPRIWTFTVLQSLALHIAGQRPLEGSPAVVLRKHVTLQTI